MCATLLRSDGFAAKCIVASAQRIACISMDLERACMRCESKCARARIAPLPCHQQMTYIKLLAFKLSYQTRSTDRSRVQRRFATACWQPRGSFKATTFRYKTFEKARDQGTSAILQHKLSGNGKRLFVERRRLLSVCRVKELKRTRKQLYPWIEPRQKLLFTNMYTFVHECVFLSTYT